MNIEIYTDGGCHGNPGPGGWAFLIREVDGDIVSEKWGAEQNTTNNRMELRAAIEALREISALGAFHPRLHYEKGDSGQRAASITLWTDSEYVKNGITTWITNWKKNGWKTANKKPVKNADLWKELDTLASSLPVNWRWVRGHDGNPFNERVDELTQHAMADSSR
jgi:ribonuclease HI